MKTGTDDGSKKRVISVGFLKPKGLDGDTIYVRLKPYESGGVEALAFSGEEFRYNGETIQGVPRNLLQEGRDLPMITNIGQNGRIAFHYEHFIQKLEKENNARSKYKYYRDGLEMVETLQEMKGLTEII